MNFKSKSNPPFSKYLKSKSESIEHKLDLNRIQIKSRFGFAHHWLTRKQTYGSDREICRTCPADVCWCPAESSDPAGHFVQQGSIHIKCQTRKIRMTTEFISHQLGKMSDRGSKCPTERWRPAGHFVRHAKNNFRDHCNISPSDCMTYHLKTPICLITHIHLIWSMYTVHRGVWTSPCYE